MNLSRLSIKRPIFLTSVVIVTLLVGFISLMRLGVDQFPDVTFPVVVTNTAYFGASPEEVETLITKPIEEEVSSTPGIKRLSSNSQEGLSVVVAEFSLGTDVKYAEQQIRDRVSSVRRDLPDDIEEPTIRRVDVSDQAIMRFSLSGDLKQTELYEIADQEIKTRFEQANDVGKVEVIGGREREIRVELDRRALKRREVSLDSVAKKIAASAQNVPVGKITAGKSETVFRTIGEYKTIDQIKNTVVNFVGSDVLVAVEDVGKVVDTTRDERNRVYLNGKSAVFLDVYKQSGSNTVAVSDALKAKLDAVNEHLAQKPGNLKVSLVRDGARFIRANVEDVKNSIIEGVLLTVLVVFVFLRNFRSTIITGLALPNSLLGAFILMLIMGFTINVMTLLALSLAVGLLIDDAIVVRENIFRKIEEGMNPVQAAEEGTQEVTLAVIATTLTVIAVFLPVGFLQGTVGQFFKQFGLTIVFAMAISLFDALTMAPMLSAYFAGKSSKHKHDATGGRLVRIYERVLDYTLAHRGRVILASVAIFVGSLVLAKNIKSTFLPNSDNGEFSVNLEMEPGTSLESMDVVAKKVQAELMKFPEIENVAMRVGGGAGEANQARIFVGLVNYKKRNIMTNDLKVLVREKLKVFPEAKPKVTDVDIVGGNQRPFTLNIYGDNLEEISNYANRLMTKFKELPGLVDIDTNYRLGKPEFQVQLDPQKIERYGVLTGVAGNELRGHMEGIVAAQFRENGREYDIRVRLNEDQRDLQKYYNETYIPNINNNLVRLSDISKGVLTVGPSRISRFNRSRTIQISADLAKGGALGNIRAEVENIIKTKEKLPPTMSYAFIGQAEDFKDLVTSMVIAVTLAVTFVFLILASLYESFITPFTIMLALPLAVVGGLIALFLFNESLNIFSMIGMIMLLGLVTKNSILLVDYALQLMQRGVDRTQAIKEAGVKRLRPILMTTLALIAGTLPVALGLSEAARSRTSMGIAIIGGLISSTLLTLVVVPAAFGYIDDFRIWSLKWLRKIFVAKDNQLPTPNNVIKVDRDHKRGPEKSL